MVSGILAHPSDGSQIFGAGAAGRVTVPPSSPLKVGLALFQKRVDTFGTVFGGKKQIEALAFVIQPTFEVGVVRLQNRLLGQPHCDRRLAGDLMRQAFGLVEELLRGRLLRKRR